MDNEKCLAAGAFEKCVRCFYYLELGPDDKKTEEMGICRADGGNIVTGLDKEGNDIQSDVNVKEL